MSAIKRDHGVSERRRHHLEGMAVVLDSMIAVFSRPPVSSLTR